MKTKIVTVPKRDKEGWLHGTKDVLVEWSCPQCGAEMGEPRPQTFCEDGEFFSVHVWENDCGHIARYRNLKVIE